MPITVPAIIGDALYAGGLAGFGYNVDVVGVFDSNFGQVFENARPIRATVNPRAKIMDHPLESGQVVSDYKIILPLEIKLPVIIPPEFAQDTYLEIWNYWQTSELLSVQTNAGNYPNMVIIEPPHEERPDRFGSLTMELVFRQVQVIQSTSSFSPADPTQTNTQAIGQQSSTATTLPASPPANTNQAMKAQFGASGSW